MGDMNDSDDDEEDEEEVEEDDDGNDGDGEEPYEDLSKKKAHSTTAGKKTALNHFNRFLAKLNTFDAIVYPYASFDTAPADYFKVFRSTFGKFGTYLFLDKRIPKWKTTRNYLSRIKVQIEEVCVDTDISKGRWYTNLIITVKTQYGVRCSEDGTSMQDSAPSMTIEDLSILAKLMWKMNTPAMLSNRSLILNDFHAMCRIACSATAKKSKLSMVNVGNIRTLSASGLETKTATEKKQVLIFMHPTDWHICPLHALGMYHAIMHSIFPLTLINVSFNFVQSIPVGDLKSFMQQSLDFQRLQATSLSKLTNEMIHCKQELVVVKQRNDQLVHCNSQLISNLQQLVGVVGEEIQLLKSSAARSANAGASTTVVSRTLISSHFTSLSSNSNSNSSAEQVTPAVVWFSHGSLGGIFASAHFKDWYVEKLSYCTPRPGTQKGCQKDMNHSAKFISLLKLFLPNNTTIAAKPESNHEQLRAWTENIIALSSHVESAAFAFCHRQLNDGPAAKRNRTRQVLAEGLFTRLNQIEESQFPVPVNVVDNATQPAYNWMTIQEIKRRR